VRSFVPEYLAHVLKGLDLNSLANKTAQPLITGSMVTDLRGPLPTCGEQRGIVEYITHEAAKIAAVYAATERTIALLKERRAALIAAAVTGKIDIQGAIA
jgi:type I restriction enzyme S subunit